MKFKMKIIINKIVVKDKILIVYVFKENLSNKLSKPITKKIEVIGANINKCLVGPKAVIFRITNIIQFNKIKINKSRNLFRFLFLLLKENRIPQTTMMNSNICKGIE